MTTYGQIEGDKSGILFNFTNSSLSWEGNILHRGPRPFRIFEFQELPFPSKTLKSL